MVNVSNIKKDFPIFENYKRKNGHSLVYLDSAASSQTPRQVVEAMNEYYFNYRANVHRGPHSLSVEATNAYERARSTVAKFIHAEAKEVVFTAGATSGVNMLVLMLERFLNLTSQNDIVVSASEHHSNFIPFQELSKRTGALMQFIPLQGTDLDYDAAERLITPQTKIVALSLASNVLGTIYDIERVVRYAKKQGAVVIIDATAAVGHANVDVRSLDCDFLFFSGHKMLGPTGVGVLYGRKEILTQLHPVFSGGGVISKVSAEATIYRESPWCFEPGTPNIAGVIGLARAVEYIESVGLGVIVQHTQELLRYAHHSLGSIPGLKIFSEKNEKKNIGIVSFVLEGMNSMDVTQKLGQQNISSRGGYHCAMPLVKTLDTAGVSRASFYIYNDMSDIDRLIEAIRNLQNPSTEVRVKTRKKWNSFFKKV